MYHVLEHVQVIPAVIQLGRQMCLSLNLLEASLYTAGGIGGGIGGGPYYGFGRKETSNEEENTRKF